jgi:hypothetical protein
MPGAQVSETQLVCPLKYPGSNMASMETRLVMVGSYSAELQKQKYSFIKIIMPTVKQLQLSIK